MADSNQDPLGFGGVNSLATLRGHWGWFVVLGVLMLVLGVAAAVWVISATLVSVLLVGVFMLVAGVAHLIQAWRVQGWGGFAFWTASGLFYAIAGGLVWYDPLAGAAAMTLVLGAALIAAGALRFWIWVNHRSQPGWGWLLFSAIITFLAGLLVALGWPGNSPWLLGILLSFDLLFQGLMLVLFGLGLRRALP
jgi:uncharacterized membrane protein HdeD (DUF308 family)